MCLWTTLPIHPRSTQNSGSQNPSQHSALGSHALGVANQNCYKLNVCAPPPNSYIEMLTPDVTVLRGGALGR